MASSSRMKWPYPDDGQVSWYENFKSLVESVDSSGFAAREDRHILVGAGDTISWSVPVLTWSGSISILAALTGFVWRVPAGNVILEEGQVLYADLPRGPTSSQNVVVRVGNQAPSTDTALVLAVRVADRVCFRSGVSLAPGESMVGFSPSTSIEVSDEGTTVDLSVTEVDFVGSGVVVTQTAPGAVEVSIAGGVTSDRYEASIIVGNSVLGDTLADCHYLDTGNGAQLAVAIAAADIGASVYIRPGTYDFAALGGPVSAITIPTGVKVRGAGRGHVVVKNRDTGDQGVFIVGEHAELEDLTIQVTLPKAAPTAGSGLVELGGSYAEVRRVNVDWPGVWTDLIAAEFNPQACFWVQSGLAHTKIVDCGAGVTDPMPSLWSLTLGLRILRGIYLDGPAASVGCDIVRFLSVEGDRGIEILKTARVRDAEISDPLLTGIYILGGTAIGSEVTGSEISMVASVAGRHGIAISGANQCDVEGNNIQASNANALSFGISLVGSSQCIIAKNRLPSNWTVGIDLDATSEENVVALNNMPPSLLQDAGSFNELAHNIISVP